MYLESIWYDADMRSKSPATKQNASNTYKPEPTNDNRTEPRPTRWAGFLDRGCGPTTHCENATLVLVVERGQDLETRTLHGGWWFQFAVVNRQLRGGNGVCFFLRSKYNARSIFITPPANSSEPGNRVDDKEHLKSLSFFSSFLDSTL